MNGPNEIVTLANNYFQDLDIKFEITRQANNVYLLKYDNKTRCIITLHVYYNYNNSYLNVDALEKCSPNSGTEILLRIIEFGKSLGVKYIKLDDGSFFTIDKKSYSIAPLEILTTGQSWYNKFGFKSSDFETEQLYNNDFVSNLPFVDVLNYSMFLENMPDKFKNNKNIKLFFADKEHDINEGTNILAEFSENFPGINTQNTIRDVLNEIKTRYLNKGIREILDENQSDVLNNLLDYLDEHILYYNKELTLDLQHTVGGKKKRKTIKKRKGKTIKKRKGKTIKK